jgi:hypothetical protein
MAGFNPAEPRSVTGQWTTGSGDQQQQQKPPPKKKKKPKKPLHHPAKKPVTHKPSAHPHAPAHHRPPPKKHEPAKTDDKKRQAMSRAQLRAEAHRARLKVKELQARAVGLRHQIHQMQEKLSSLYRLHHGGSSKKPASSSRSSSSSSQSGAAAQSGSASSSQRSGSSSSSRSSSSSSSTASQIASTQAGLSSLRSKLKAVESQITDLKAQAASLSAQAAKKAVEEPVIMTADLLEKAATLTGSGELTYVNFPIEKIETTADGDLTVYGKATDGSVDSDEQIVDPDFSAKAIQEWLSTGGNVRVQHNPQRDPAGVGMSAEPGPDGSQWVKSLVIEPVAKRLVSKGALRAYSVGIAKPVIVRDNVARGGRITGGQIVEISLVDRPANKNCGIQLVKAAGSDGHPEYSGKVFGASDVVAKAAGMSVEEVEKSEGVVGIITLELPEDVEISFSPTDLEKILKSKRPTVEKRQLEDGRVVDSGGRDVSDVSDDDFAGPGKTYPIKTRDDVSDAASLAHHADDPGAVRARIRSIAQRKFGMGDDDLPPSLKADEQPQLLMKDDGGDGCKLCGGSGKIREGHVTCPDCHGSSGKKSDPEPEAEKSDGAPPCRLCTGSGKIREGHVTCPKCKGSGNMGAGEAAAEKAAAEKAQRKAERDAVREAILEGLVEKDDGKGKDADADADADEDGDDDSDDGTGTHHSGEGMDEGLDAAKGSMPPWLKKKPAAGDDDEDEDSGKDDSDDDEDDEKASKGRKILPGGPKKKGKKQPKESPPAKSLAGDEKPVSEATHVTLDGKPTSYMKAAKPTVGHGTEPVPEHREPDGPYIEDFEHDAGLPTDPDSNYEMKTAKRHRAIGVSSSLGALHDLTCPAFEPDAAQKSHPHASLADLIDTSEWQRIAMDMAATAPIADAIKAQDLWDAAICLKTAEPELILDIKLEANKAFSDANPGPGQGLTPQSPFTPGRFSRPYLTTGHAAPSPGHDGPNSGPVPAGQISASSFGRGYLTAGHAANSPSSHSIPAPLHSQGFGGAPISPDVPSMKAGSGDMITGPAGRPSNASRRFYTNAQRDNARQAMKAMHDHIAQTFPDLCPMGGQQSGPDNPVPDAVKADELAPARKTKKAKRRVDVTDLVGRLEKLVLKGQMTIEDARDEILKAQAPADDTITKAAVAGEAGVSADVIKAAVMEAVEEATTDLMSEIKRLRKRVNSYEDRFSALEEGPDPRVSAWKGVAMTPPAPPQYAPQASAVPAGMPSMTEIAERTQVMVMKELEEQFRYSPDPAQREAAWTAICKMRGL